MVQAGYKGDVSKSIGVRSYRKGPELHVPDILMRVLRSRVCACSL